MWRTAYGQQISRKSRDYRKTYIYSFTVYIHLMYFELMFTNAFMVLIESSSFPFNGYTT